MLCEDCKKRPATHHVTQVVEDKTVTLQLCKQCAAKRGFHSPFENSPFPLSQLLSGMLSGGKESKEDRISDKACPGCGLTFREFSETGKLGCGRCYRTFRVQLDDLLRKIHGSCEHRGATPRSPAKEVAPVLEEHRLKEMLKAAIAEEDFERAAEIRDQIKALREEITG